MIGFIVVAVWLVPVVMHARWRSRLHPLYFEARPLMTFLRLGRPLPWWRRWYLFAWWRLVGRWQEIDEFLPNN